MTRDKIDAVTIVDEIAAQVARTPGAPAVVADGGVTVTYAELAARANRLARELRDRGAGTGARVAIALDRSVDLVVAMLGTLVAGAAYVPLDPSYPANRLAFMLDDARTAALVTQPAQHAKLTATRVPIVVPPSAGDATALAATIPPHAPAYVIYTSGSTGVPKGVVIPHAALHNHMTWMQAEFPLSAADRVLQKTPSSFDASVWEFWAPLLAGATLVLARPDGHRDASYLVEVIQREAITIVQVVPSLLRMLLDEPGFAGCRSLRRVFCGGEALLPADLRALHARLPAAEVVNLYGPTECTIDSVCWRSDGRDRATVPIGRPIANTTAYVLDADLRPTTDGEEGELYLAGACVGSGYLARPQLTAQRFLPAPSGGRMYRTGDRVRRTADGELEYLGRTDDQVKLRGFRIELTEIEALLREHAGVRQAAVVLAGSRLVAHVVPARGATVDAAALRAHLAERAPDYMIPVAFGFVTELPLAPGGKVDKAALPQLDEVAPARTGHVPPASELERQVAAIWEAVLEVRPIGLTDDFFQLGGDSVQAHVIVGRLRKALGRKLSIRELFETPVLGAFTARLVARAASDSRALPPIVPTTHTGDAPCTFVQEGHWLLQNLVPETAVYNVAIALRITGELDADMLATALDALLARHDILRTTCAFDGDDPLQHVHDRMPAPLVRDDLSGLAGEAQARALDERQLAHGIKPFDLARGPLIRFCLYRLSPTEHLLDMVQHHVITDEWSIRLIAREIAALYAALRARESLPPPRTAIRYRDYAVWQRQHVKLDRLTEQVAYWKQQLAGVARLELPVDHARPTTRSLRGETVRVPLADAATTTALHELAARTNATLFMVLHAALAQLLAQVARQSDIAIGTPIAGRVQQETESVLGCFVNTLVLRMQVPDGATFADVLEHSKRTTLAAYGAQDVPFEQLVVALRPPRMPGWTPLFQCLMQVQNEVVAMDPAGQLAWQQENRLLPGALVDLFVCFSESPEGLVGMFQYASDLFERATVERWLAGLRDILATAAAEPA